MVINIYWHERKTARCWSAGLWEKLNLEMHIASLSNQ